MSPGPKANRACLPTVCWAPALLSISSLIPDAFENWALHVRALARLESLMLCLLALRRIGAKFWGGLPTCGCAFAARHLFAHALHTCFLWRETTEQMACSFLLCHCLACTAAGL